jgi:hypothetical protein
MNRIVVFASGIAALVVAAAVISWGVGSGTERAFAHGTVDQTQTNGNFCANLDLFDITGQSFTPAASTIVGVDLRLHVFASMRFSVVLREGGTNPENGVALAAVSKNLGGGDQIVHFDFPQTVTVTPGNTYFLEIDSSAPNQVLPCGTGENIYAGGQAFAVAFAGSAPPADLQFTTYSETPPPTQPPTPAVRPTRTPRP